MGNVFDDAIGETYSSFFRIFDEMEKDVGAIGSVGPRDLIEDQVVKVGMQRDGEKT